MKKKQIFVTLAVVVVLLLSAGIYYLYCSYNPYIKISIGGTFANKEHYIEHVSVSYSTNHGIPLAKSLQENLIELGDWNNEVVTDLVMGSYIDPIKISVSGEVKDGKTRIRYEGIVTTKDGETQEYFKEKTFDFVLVPDEKLLK